MVFEQQSIGEVIRNGVAFDPRNWGRPMNESDLINATRDLFVLLHERQINYVLVGGIAMLQYVEGRNTQDIGLIISLPSLKQLPEIVIDSRNANFARRHLGALQIDLLFTTNTLFKAVERDYTAARVFQDQVIQTASVEGLIALKLYALPSLYRQGNFNKVAIYESDVSRLLEQYEPETDALLQLLETHLDTADMVEIRQILHEIAERIARFRRRASE